MKFPILVLGLLMLFTTGCNNIADEQTAMNDLSQVATDKSWTETPSQTYTQTPTISPTSTDTLVPTDTPTPTAVPLPEMQKVNEDGFGDPNTLSVFALEVFQENLYAGTRNHITGCEIWRYDGSNWEAVVRNCFGKPHNYSVDDFIVFNGKLYAGLSSGSNEAGIYEGAELWRSDDGINWEKVVSKGFGAGGRYSSIARLIEFENFIYAVTWDGGTPEVGLEIWRSPSGNLGEWTRVVKGGFGKPENATVTSSAIFNEKLYVGTFTLSSTAEIYSTLDGVSWDFVNDFNLDGIFNRRVSALNVFKDHLYAAVIEKGAWDEIIARVYRCLRCDGGDWEMVFDGPYEQPGTYRKPGLEVYGDYIYCVVGNYFDLGNNSNTKGLEIWRTRDGLDWERLAYGGIEDENNAWTYFDNAMVVFNGDLYIGLDNKVTGAEIWMISE